MFLDSNNLKPDINNEKERKGRFLEQRTQYVQFTQSFSLLSNAIVSSVGKKKKALDFLGIPIQMKKNVWTYQLRVM